MQSRLYFGQASASPDITLALTGQAVTASTGTLSPGMGLPLSGTEATGATGTLSLATSVAMSGQAATTSAGTITPSMAIALLGQAIAGEAGDLVYGEVEGSLEEPPRAVSGLGNYAYGVRRKKKLPEELIEAVEAVAEAAEDETGLVAALDGLERDMAAAVRKNRGLVERFAYQELVAFLEAEQRRLRAIEIAALERHLAERKRLMEMVDAEAEELLALLQIID